MTERGEIERALLDWMAEAKWKHDDDRFDDLALRLFSHQTSANVPYQRFCQARGRMPQDVSSWLDMPAVPAGAFKEMELRCFPPEATVRIFRTSGTTGTRRGALHLDTLALYEASLERTLRKLFMPDLAGDVVGPSSTRTTIRILAPSPDEAMDSSLSYMFGRLLEDLGDNQSGFDVRGGDLDLPSLFFAIEAAYEADRPLSLCGTAFAFIHLLDACAERGLRFQCPAGSRIMETGGFKGRSRELAREPLYAALHETLGIEPIRMVNQYGMTELGSQFYDSVIAAPTEARRKLGPPWVRVRLVDPETGEDAREGEPGLIVIHDLANTGSVATVQTADLGRFVDAGGEGARGFDVLGREAGAEERGCSIAADLMLGGAAGNG